MEQKMTRREAVFLAKRNVVDTIWKSANLEGINITFPETYAIYEKAKMSNVDLEAVNVVLNLKHAWQLLFKTLDEPIDLSFVERIHAEASKDEALTWGELRTGHAGISGTDYIPPIPTSRDVEERLEEFRQMEQDLDRALERMLYMMKAKLFWDGNKRTAMIVANKDLIESGLGILAVKGKDIFGFNRLLSDYYTYDKSQSLKDFIAANCIQRIVQHEKNHYKHDEPDLEL